MQPVDAVIVGYDSASVLPSCLTALIREGARPIVVNNASTDGTLDAAQSLRVQIINNRQNEGYGRANNIGVQAAQSEWVLIINPDAVIDPGSLESLMQAATLYPDAAMLAPRLVEPDGRVFFQFRSLLSPYLKNKIFVKHLPEGDCCVPFLSGAALLVRRDVFLQIGGFDENIFLFFEDDDLCRRVIDAGYSLVHVHNASVRHQRGASSAPNRARIFTARWHLAWSRAYIGDKYGLENPAVGMAIINGFKALGACLLLNRDRMARYGGSAAGALAWLRGKTALARQGLSPRQKEVCEGGRIPPRDRSGHGVRLRQFSSSPPSVNVGRDRGEDKKCG